MDPILLQETGIPGNQASYSTAGSYTPTANKLVVAVVDASFTAGSGQNTPTASGNGLTWELIASVSAVGNSTQRGQWWFAAAGSSPTTTGFSANFGGQTQANCTIYVVEFPDADISGGVAAAFVQVNTASNDASGTSLSVTLNAFADAVNNI
jgi:hypothetical protein